MTVSYLDTLQGVRTATTDGTGLGYAEITKAMRVHVRSLVAEGHVACFDGDDNVVTLDDPSGRVFLTVKGLDYVELMASAGLLNTQDQEPKAPAKRTTRRRRSSKPKASTGTVPTPTESVTVTVVPPSPKAPQPTGEVFDPSPKAQQTTVTTIPVGDRMAALESDMSTIKSALEILVGSIS